MARGKQKNPKLTTEVNTIDEIYVENDDLLRSIKLEECNLDEEISKMECLLQEQNNKKDPNRSVFHVSPKYDFDVSIDEIRMKLYELQESKKTIQERIAVVEKRLAALHSVKKILYKADSPEEDLTVSLPVVQEVAAVAEEPPRYVASEVISQLEAATEKIELSERFITFDPERSKLELEAVKNSISEVANRLKDFSK